MDNKVAELTDRDDTVIATTENVLDKASVLDSSTTDNDVLNAVLTKDIAPAVIRNVETINVDFKGRNITLDASSISNGTIVASTSHNFNDTAKVSNLTNNNVNVAVGSGISKLDIAGAGSAATSSVILAGDTLDLISTEMSNLTLVNNVADSIVVLTDNTAKNTLTATGNHNIILKTDASGINGDTIISNMTGESTFTIDITKFGADADLTGVSSNTNIVISDTSASGTGTFANNAMITLAEKTGFNGNQNFVFKTDAKGSEAGKLLISADGNLASQTIKADVTELTLNNNLENNSLAGLSGANEVIVTGNGIKLGTWTAGKVGNDAYLNASELKGGMDVSTADTMVGNIDIVGSSFNDVVTISKFGANKNGSIQAGAGNDVLTVKAVEASGTATIDGGEDSDIFKYTSGEVKGDLKLLGDAGDDIFHLPANVGGAAGSGTVEVAGGAGSDSFLLADIANSGSGKITITDFTQGEDRLVIVGNSATAGSGIDVSSVKYTAASGLEIDGAKNSFFLEGVQDGDLKDYVQLGTDGNAFVWQVGTTGDLTLKAGSFDDYITTSGTSGATIEAGKGGDHITIAAAASGSADTIKINASDSLIDNHDVVYNFTVAATSGDKLDLATSGIAGTSDKFTFNGVELAAKDASGVVDIAKANVGASNLDAFLQTLADATSLDGKTIAFELAGSTYIFQGAADSKDTLVELVGVTGVTALGDTAGANKIAII